MREDLAKLTTERERYGHSALSKKWGGKVRVEDPDSTYDREVGGLRAHSRHRNGNYKTFSDVLNPLNGVLHKNVGRPWDKVYSEFCKVLDNRSNSGLHIIGHLKDMVAINCVMENGKIYEQAKRFWGRYEVDGYYVHPKTRLLCLKPYVSWKRRYPKKPDPITNIKMQDGTEYVFEDHFLTKQGDPRPGIWFKGKWVDVTRKVKSSRLSPRKEMGETEAGTDYKGWDGKIWEYYFKLETERKFINKQTCNKKELEFIRSYIAKQEQKARRKQA